MEFLKEDGNLDVEKIRKLPRLAAHFLDIWVNFDVIAKNIVFPISF